MMAGPQTSLTCCAPCREGECWRLQGHKWWASGAMDPRCHIAIFMGRSRSGGPQHTQQSMVLVPLATPGVRVVRPLHVLGFDDAPHGHAEVLFQVRPIPGRRVEGKTGFRVERGAGNPAPLFWQYWGALCMACVPLAVLEAVRCSSPGLALRLPRSRRQAAEWLREACVCVRLHGPLAA